MAKYYPINLALENKKCLVIGAGGVAERKVKRLLECGARVEVISPKITPGLNALALDGRIHFKKRKVRLGDLKRGFLVIAATDDRGINAAVSSFCLKNDILINVVDSPKECNFILPSIIRRGALTISISTDGVSPALSKKIRQELEKMFGSEYSKLLRILKNIRIKAIKEIKDSRARKVFFKKALGAGIMALLKKGKEKEVKKKLEGMLKNA